MSQKYKSHTDVTVWTKSGNIVIPEFVKKQERDIQAAIQQSSLSKDNTYLPEENHCGDSDEDNAT
jgi:hypothetical protein